MLGKKSIPQCTGAAGTVASSTTMLTSEEKDELAELTFKSPLAVRVSILLSKLGVTHACWLTSSCGRFYEVHLTYEGGFKCERLVHEMNSLGVGTTQGSSINCLPISLHSSIRAQFNAPQLRPPPKQQTMIAPSTVAAAALQQQQQQQQQQQSGQFGSTAPNQNLPFKSSQQEQGEFYQHQFPASTTGIPDLLQRKATSESIQTAQMGEQFMRIPIDPEIIDGGVEQRGSCESDSLVRNSRNIHRTYAGSKARKGSAAPHKSTAASAYKRSKLKRFMKTIRSRLTVQEVLSAIMESTTVTFDYVVLGFLASIISGVGLIINSSVVIVASMLISPLMGPILAIVFAIVIRDFSLLKKGVRAEFIGTCICLTVGYVMGIIDALPRIDQEMSTDYPTEEMCTRGQFISLLTGIFIALPSGAGVAISVLGGNVGSLVGVAISASLLPPAVNCGILYGYATVAVLGFKQHNLKVNLTHEEYCLVGKGEKMLNVTPIALARIAAASGSVSLLLTLLNVVCIIFMGYIVLKVKQVAPISTFTDTFWKEDVKTAKHYYQTIEREDASRMREEYLKYLKEYLNENNVQTNQAPTTAADDYETDAPEEAELHMEKLSTVQENLDDISKELKLISHNVFRLSSTGSVGKANALLNNDFTRSSSKSHDNLLENNGKQTLSSIPAEQTVHFELTDDQHEEDEEEEESYAMQEIRKSSDQSSNEPLKPSKDRFHVVQIDSPK